MQKQKTTVDYLKLGRKRLAKPEHWIKEQFSNGRGGYCILGACDYLRGGGSVDRPILNAIWELYPGVTVSTAAGWNDGIATHEAVIAVLDRAIEMESAKTERESTKNEA